jgi:hypothetical protein
MLKMKRNECICIVFAITCMIISVTANSFSGVYQPNLDHSMELYAAAWLVPRQGFLDSKPFMETVGNLEGATFSVVANGREPLALMTRDYFDMFVEHLSAYTNLASSKPLTVLLIKRMTDSVRHYKRIIEKIQHRHQSKAERPFHNNTVVILPFTLRAHGADPIPNTEEIRRLFFQLTYYSVCLHFPNLAVAVEDEFHLAELQKLDLMVTPFHIFKCYRQAGEEFVKYNLMKDMLNKTYNELSSSPDWAHFEYVYFTESDQILHLQHEKEMYDMLKDNNDTLFMVPHRINVRSSYLFLREMPCIFVWQ